MSTERERLNSLNENPSLVPDEQLINLNSRENFSVPHFQWTGDVAAHSIMLLSR